ncbi:hypothetical protein AGMMS49992_15270 [Clostridia bacterium]|nr:hypothetical protein AGMMS49992_15270 [Clostridia bacterium]
MNLRNCIDLRPSYQRYANFPSILYLLTPRGGSTKFLCEVCGLGMPGAKITLRIDNTIIAPTYCEPDGTWCFNLDQIPLLHKGDHQIKVVHDDGAGPKETAYANFYVTKEYEDYGTLGDALEAREEYCATRHDPTLKLFSLSMVRPTDANGHPICYTSSDLSLGLLQVQGTLVRKWKELTHNIKLTLFEENKSTPIDVTTLTVDATSGIWAAGFTSTTTTPAGKPYDADLNAYLLSQVPASGTKNYALYAKDENTGEQDIFSFCTTA